MNSCLYECLIYHTRLEPKVYKFKHKIFMFYLDLDEIDLIAKKNIWISKNRFNLYSYFDRDHLGSIDKSTKENLLNYVRDRGVVEPIEKVFLLTNLRIFGYVFNPVSFYFCFDEKGIPVCVVPEVSNTFREMKAYLLRHDKLVGDRYVDRIAKFFYVSPFMDMDVFFNFDLKIPGEKLELIIDETREKESSKKIFYSGIVGEKKPLTSWSLFLEGVRFPWVTVKIIFFIHWHAWMLYLKKIPFFRKTDKPELQRDIVLPKESKR